MAKTRQYIKSDDEGNKPSAIKCSTSKMTTQSIDPEIKATLDSLFGGKDTSEDTSKSSKPTFAELREQGNGIYSLSPQFDPEKDFKGTLHDLVTKEFTIRSFDGTLSLRSSTKQQMVSQLVQFYSTHMVVDILAEI